MMDYSAILSSLVEVLPALGVGTLLGEGVRAWRRHRSEQSPVATARAQSVILESTSEGYTTIIEQLRAENARLVGANERVEALLAVERAESNERQRQWAQERSELLHKLDEMEQEFMAEISSLRRRLASHEEE